jgi:hypothetical protein
MREPKYLNESGGKTGNWYLNRFEYFEFYGFQGETKLKIICVMVCVSSYLALFSAPLYLFVLLAWLVYVSSVTLYVLHKKICKINGYFCFPKYIINRFKRYEKQIDLSDFDSIATLSKDK